MPAPDPTARVDANHADAQPTIEERGRIPAIGIGIGFVGLLAVGACQSVPLQFGLENGWSTECAPGCASRELLAVDQQWREVTLLAKRGEEWTVGFGDVQIQSRHL